MSPAGPESASNESKIQAEQLRIDTIDRKSDGKVEGNDGATPEQVAERTKAYVNRVNDVQGRIRSLRQKVVIGKEMKNPNWPALEKACNDVEGGLAQKLVAVTVENLESGIPEFSASIDRFLLSLQEEEVRNVRRYAAGSIDYGQLRRRSDEAYNTTLVAARKTGGVPHLSAIDEVIRSNETELAHLKGGWAPPNWNFALWGTPAERREALEGALPAYRKERNDVLTALPKDQATIQALSDRSDQAWVTFNTARSASPVVKQAVVEKLEFLIDVNVEERTHLSSYPNQGTVNDKTGEIISSRIKRIEDQLPGYRLEYAQLRDETAPLGVDSPKTGVQQLFEQLTAGAPVEPKLLQSYVKTATEVYGETPLRLIVSRVSLVNKLNPAICEASGFPFRPPVDIKQLAVQLGRGVLPARPTPEQAETVTHAYLMGRPEDLIRRKYEFVLDRTVEPQKKIESLQTFIQNETKNLANETRGDADEEKVARLAKNIRSAQEGIRKEQEGMASLQQILFHFESALTVFDATVAKNEGRQQESDRIYLKMREKYGPDLSRMDPDLGKRVTEAIEGLKKRNQLTPFELAMTEGRDQDAVKLAVDRQRGNIDSDYLAQARTPPQRVDVDSLSGRRRMRTEPGGGDDFRPLDLAAMRGARSGRLVLGGDLENPREKYTKAAKEFLLSQNGQNGVTVKTVGEGNSFLTMYSVDTATVKGTFSCNFDGEWSFNQAKPSYRYGFADANWFTDPAIPEGERNALNAIHRGLIERSDPEVRRRREERAAGPELGSYEAERSNPMFERQRYVSTSFSMFEFDAYGGKYDGQDVTVNITTNRTVGMGQGQPLFKLSVMGKDHLVGVADGFISKLASVPNGMTAVLRRQPTKPTFGAVLRIPNRDFSKPPRYEQLVSNYDSLTADDIAYVKLGRSMDEMREVENRGLEILAKHSPEITRRRDWSRGPDALELDTHVLVRKGGLVVEYLFSTTDGAWFCREVERDGKKFDDLAARTTFTNRGYHPAAEVRYSGSDAARMGFNTIGEELSKMEAGSTGRSGLQIAGEPVANPAPAEQGALALVNFRSGRRNALIPDIEKREAEESHDVLRAIDNDAAVRGVLSGASKISGSISLIQSLFAAGKDGTRRAGLVDLMREQAGSILSVLNDPAMKTNLLRARGRLEELKRVNTGVDKSAIDQEIDKRIKAIDDMEAMMSKPDLRQFCEHIRDAGEYTESTFWNWLEENIVTIVAIVVACLAVVLAVFTFGITSPLAVAAISATAGVIASEVTSEARFQLHQEFDEEVTSGRATFRNRSRTGAFTRAVIKDEKIFNPDTNTMEHADVLTHLVDPLGRDFVTGFVTTLAFMGAGAVIGKGLTVLANTNCAQALIANSPRLTRIVAYLSKAEQGAPLAQKNMKTFMSQWGKETAEEFRDEAAERIAGDWASVVFIAKRNFKPKNPADAKALARSDAAVRNMGEFQYETNGNPVLTIANITASLIAEGGTVTVDANGKITANIDGRVFLLSPDVEVSGLTPAMIASPPALPAAPLMTPLERENLMKMVGEARTDTKYLVSLKLFLKTNNVDDATRIEIAEKLLGRTLGDTERTALLAAHRTPGVVDNLSGAETFAKGRLLLAAFPRPQAQLLLDAAVCGTVDVTAMNRQQRSELLYDLRNTNPRTADQDALLATLSRAIVTDVSADPKASWDDRTDMELAREFVSSEPVGPVGLPELPGPDAVRGFSLARLRALASSDIQPEVAVIANRVETATGIEPALQKQLVAALLSGDLVAAETHAKAVFDADPTPVPGEVSIAREIRVVRVKFELQRHAREALPTAARTEGVALAEAARKSPDGIKALKDFLKSNNVDDGTRVAIAEALVGRPLTDGERKAMLEAHRQPGTIDDLSGAEVFGKARLLLAAFDRPTAQLLLDGGVCGDPPFDARRGLTGGREYTVRTSEGKLTVATFLRVQNGNYIFSLRIGTTNVETTVPLNNVVGYANVATDRGPRISTQVLLAHLQGGAPVTMRSTDPGGPMRTYRFVRVSNNDSEIYIMQDTISGRQERFGRAVVAEAVVATDPAPTAAPSSAETQYTDLQVMEELAKGLRVNIGGVLFDCVSQASPGRLVMHNVVNDGLVTLDAAPVFAAARIAMAAEANTAPRPAATPRPAPAPAPTEVQQTDQQLINQLYADGAQVRLNYGGVKDQYTLVRVSNKDPNKLVMRNVRTGVENRMRKSDVVAAMRRRPDAVQNDANLPVAATIYEHSDFVSGQSYQVSVDGRVETWEYVGPQPDNAAGDACGRFGRMVGTRTEFQTFPLDAAVGPTGPRVAPAPAAAPAAPAAGPDALLTVAALRSGQVYQITRSDGRVQQWRYLGDTHTNGNPRFEPLTGDEGPNAFPLSRVSRVPATAPRPAAAPATPGPAAEAPLALTDLQRGQTYNITRTDGSVQQWRFLGPDAEGKARFEPVTGSEAPRTFLLRLVSRIPAAAPRPNVAPSRPANAAETREIPRPREVLAVPDIHGDAVAFESSLRVAGYIEVNANGTWKLTEHGKNSRIILTGDLVDRGNQNLAVLDRILELQKLGAKVDLIAGNHDVFMIDALRTGSDTSMMTWLQNGGFSVLEEIAAKYGIEKTNLDGQLAKARELFLGNGKYAAIFGEMKLMVQVDDVLYVHAGIDATWADILDKKGIDGANAEFRALMTGGRLSEMMEGERLAGPLWIRGFAAGFTADQAAVLQRLGVRVIVHGHDKVDTDQTTTTVHGIQIINGDVGMSSAYNGRPASVRVGRDGKVEGRSGNNRNGLGTLPTRPPRP